MNGFSCFCLIFMAIAFIIMMSIMIIFERDKPKHIISWTIVFLVSQFIGYGVFLVFKIFAFKKRHSLVIKQTEDQIYNQLIKDKLTNQKYGTQDELFDFNKLAYNANVTKNNSYEIFTSYAKFKESLLKDLKNANAYIFLELEKITRLDFEDVKNVLIEKASKGIVVKLVYDTLISPKIKKELIKSGVRIKSFSEYSVVGGSYANLRNQIIIDGNISYLGRLDANKKQVSGKIDVDAAYIKFKGEVVQDMNVAIHQDIVFSTGKFIEYKESKKDSISSDAKIQFVSNEQDTDIELLIIKAICTAKKSIQLQLEKFIPTESIMSLLRFAINSNIDVKLMIPLKTGRDSKYYASRAYAKELALFGAKVYLFDGYIRFNAITIDAKYVIYGNYVIDREYITNALQNIVLFEDAKAVNTFNKEFEAGINNSYKINNAKYMLIREKFFKNFV